MAVVARTWERALHQLGWQTITIAGDSPADYNLDVHVEGLGMAPSPTVDVPTLTTAVEGADLLLCENILSLPLNPAATRAVSNAAASMPTIAHHHDLTWQSERYHHLDYTIPQADHLRHVVINQQSLDEFTQRYIPADLVYNCFDTSASPGNRQTERATHRFEENELVVVHPSRAIARKNIPAAIRLVEQLAGTYWLTGPAENDYEDELANLLRTANCRIVHQPATNMADMYAASDLVVFPSHWEGFGNPPIEAAIFRRLAAVGAYPVSAELRNLGFVWFDPSDPHLIQQALQSDHQEVLAHNAALAQQHFSFDRLVSDIDALLASMFT